MSTYVVSALVMYFLKRIRNYKIGKNTLQCFFTLNEKILLRGIGKRKNQERRIKKNKTGFDGCQDCCKNWL